MLSVYHLLIPLGTPPCITPCLSHPAWIPHQDSIGQGQPQTLTPHLIMTKESRLPQSVYFEYTMTLHLTRGNPLCVFRQPPRQQRQSVVLYHAMLSFQAPLLCCGVTNTLPPPPVCQTNLYYYSGTDHTQWLVPYQQSNICERMKIRLTSVDAWLKNLCDMSMLIKTWRTALSALTLLRAQPRLSKLSNSLLSYKAH